MRRFLLGAILFSGCFSPTGNETAGGSGTGETAATTAAPMSTGSGSDTTTGAPTTATTDTTSPAVTTGGVTTSGMTTGTADPTTVSTTGPGTDATSDATSGTTGTTNTTNTTGDPGCNPPCGQCFTCEAGACVNKPGIPPCVPEPGACAGKVWGEQNGTCYEASADSGFCDGEGVCQPTCNQQGGALVTCIDAGCVRPLGPCQPGALASDVNLANFCESGGNSTPGCTTACNNGVLESSACQFGGSCELKNSYDCMGYACDPILLDCKVLCMAPSDCAPMYQCIAGACKQ